MKGYRTIAVNVLLAVIPFLEMTELYDVMPDEWIPWLVLGAAFGNMYLRTVTTTPIGKKS